MKKTDQWYPHCIHLGKPMGYSAHGHILPCCWANNDDPGFSSLQKESLKLECNDSVNEIFQSTEWQEFYEILTKCPEKAPATCWKYCGNGPEYRIKETAD